MSRALLISSLAILVGCNGTVTPGGKGDAHAGDSGPGDSIAGDSDPGDPGSGDSGNGLLPHEADVYRDDNGVPHIEAGSEEAAWYAIGYEEARDSLFHIQVNVKWVRGHAAQFIGSGPGRVRNDFVVQALNLYLDLDPTEMQALLRLESSPTGNPDQVYDNLVAYVLGVNDYRLALAAGDVDAGELDARVWLEANDYDWALTDEVTLADVVSWGRWTRGGLQWGMASIMDRNPHWVDIAAPARKIRPDAPPRRAVWQDPTETEEWVQIQNLGGRKAIGSNSYAWSHDYMEIDGVPHTGMVADPHQTSRWWPDPEDPMSLFDLAHVWFVHVRVPNGARPLDAFGYLQHATGMMFLQHNDDVAVGGSAGAANIADGFLLRLKTDAAGEVEQPMSYYSVYADTDLDDGADPEDWVPFVSREITVDVDESTHLPFTHTVLYAGPYGIIPNTTPFYADLTERFTPRQMTYAGDPAPGLSPVLVAYRLPILDGVDGAAHHDRFVVGMYELMHARDVYDVIDNVNDHEFAYMIQFDAVDRWGRLFAVTCGAIPQRGDDALLMAAGYNAFPDKLFLYAFGSDPIPARTSADRMFNWVHVVPGDPTSGVRFLKAEGDGGQDDPDYLPYVLFDPEDEVYNPPTHLGDPSDPLFGENPGFASNSNDVTFHAYKKRETYAEKTSATGNPFNIVVTDNELVNQTLEAGTAYHTCVWPATLEGHLRSKHTIDHLSDILRENMEPGTGSPKMDLAGGLDFAQDNRLYVERDYKGPDGNGARAELDGLPVPVRMLVEAYLELDSPGGVIEEFDDEVHFFRDLWTALYQPPSGSHWESYPLDPGAGVFVDLKSAWVGDGTANPGAVFYYPVDDNGAPGPVAIIEMPPLGRLIDFLWEGSFPGAWQGDDLVAFTSAERSRLDQLMQLLIDWDDAPAGQRFKNASGSRAAAFLAEFHLGFEAAEYDRDVSRSWVPLYSGLLGADTDADATCPVAPGVVALSADGRMPALGASGALGSGLFPRVIVEGYRELQLAADPGKNPYGDYQSLFGTGPFQPIDGFVGDLPYDALYSDVDGRVVRETLEPEHINALVEFFFNLGGWDLNPAAGRIDSAKLAVYGLPGMDCGGGVPRGDTLATRVRPGYPLTRSMVRILVLRRLLDTDAVLQQWYGELPTFGDIFRTRAYDYDGDLRYPTESSGPLEEGLPMEGGGILRSVACRPEAGVPLARGYQRKMYCAGGSARPIFTFFPKDRPNEAPKSFFWNPPGQNTARFDSVHFADHTDAFRANTPLPTRLRDYRSHPSPEYPSPVRYEYGAP